MYYMIINVYVEKYIEDILLALTEMGIKDVQVINSVNESRRLAHNIPLFAGFKEDLGEASPYGRIMFAVVKDKKIVEDFVKVLKKSGIDFLEKGLGSIVFFPIEKKIP